MAFEVNKKTNNITWIFFYNRYIRLGEIEISASVRRTKMSFRI